jgi:hypothetical protein
MGKARTIIGIPSLDLGPRYLARTDLAAMESRWMYLTLALRDPAARVAVVTSARVEEPEVDQFLALVGPAARDRLLLLSLDDDARRPLAGKLLDRPDAIDALRRFARGDVSIVPFAVGETDEAIAAALGARLLGIGRRFAHHGTKSGSRRLLARAGVPIPAGVEDVRDTTGVAAALARLHGPAVVKLDGGVTGDGNAVVEDPAQPLPAHIAAGLPDGAVVEALVDGPEITSPSVQVRIADGGRVEVLATHEQALDGHRYVGCRMPARPEYARQIAGAGERVGRVLAQEGARGRFAVDFVARREDDGAEWTAYGVEVNLREGATTHPLATLALLTGGRYDAADGRFRTAAGGERRYVATDRAASAAELLARGRRYDPATQTGLVLFMASAFGRGGPLGYVAIDDPTNPITSIGLGNLEP